MAQQRVEQVRAHNVDGDYRLRLQVDTHLADGTASTLQLKISGHRLASAHRYELKALSPAAIRGQVYTVALDDGTVSVTTPEGVQLDGAAARAAMDVPLFNSDLSLGDLAGQQWARTAGMAVGQAEVLDQPCDIVTLNGSPALRACISGTLGLPLLSEQLDTKGAVVRRYRAQALNRSGEEWVVRSFDIEHPQRGSTSRVQIIGASFGP